MSINIKLKTDGSPRDMAESFKGLAESLPASDNPQYAYEGEGQIAISRTSCFYSYVLYIKERLIVPQLVQQMFPSEVFTRSLSHYNDLLSLTKGGSLNADEQWESGNLSSRPCVRTWDLLPNGNFIVHYRANDVVNKLLLNVLFLLAIQHFSCFEPKLLIIHSESIHVRKASIPK